jgi:hypothetical protein
MSKFKKKQGNVTPGISTASLAGHRFHALIFLHGGNQDERYRIDG